MFNAIGWIPVEAGLRDGVNPCMLMTGSMVLIILIGINQRGINKFWFLYFFVVVLLSSFVLNCGFLDKFLLNRYFFSLARFFYMALSIVLLFCSVILLREWYLLFKGVEIKRKSFKVWRVSAPLFLLIFTCLGFILSSLTILWPPNYFITVIGMYMQRPGQEMRMASLLLLYTLTSYWVIYFVVWSASLETKNPRLFKVIVSAILLASSLSILDIILMKG